MIVEEIVIRPPRISWWRTILACLTFGLINRLAGWSRA